MTPDLQPGDVLLCHSDAFVSKLIRFGETVRYHGWRKGLQMLVGRWTAPVDDPTWANHAAVYVGDGQLIEALGSGLVMSPVSKYGPDAYRVAPLAEIRQDVSAEARADLVAFAKAQLLRHGPYGWLSIASIVVQILTPSKLDLSYDGALICSAFAAQCWEHAGLILPTRSSLTTSPADLAAWLDRCTKVAA